MIGRELKPNEDVWLISLYQDKPTIKRYRITKKYFDKPDDPRMIAQLCTLDGTPQAYNSAVIHPWLTADAYLSSSEAYSELYRKVNGRADALVKQAAAIWQAWREIFKS